jgi:hypothetical protein
MQSTRDLEVESPAVQPNKPSALSDAQAVINGIKEGVAVGERELPPRLRAGVNSVMRDKSDDDEQQVPDSARLRRTSYTSASAESEATGTPRTLNRLRQAALQTAARTVIGAHDILGDKCVYNPLTISSFNYFICRSHGGLSLKPIAAGLVTIGGGLETLGSSFGTWRRTLLSRYRPLLPYIIFTADLSKLSAGLTPLLKIMSALLLVIIAISHLMAVYLVLLWLLPHGPMSRECVELLCVCAALGLLVPSAIRYVRNMAPEAYNTRALALGIALGRAGMRFAGRYYSFIAEIYAMAMIPLPELLGSQHYEERLPQPAEPLPAGPSEAEVAEAERRLAQVLSQDSVESPVAQLAVHPASASTPRKLTRPFSKLHGTRHLQVAASTPLASVSTVPSTNSVDVTSSATMDASSSTGSGATPRQGGQPELPPATGSQGAVPSPAPTGPVRRFSLRRS